MNYELAKELRDAGFSTERLIERDGDFTDEEIQQWFENPTLSELISAFTSFARLEHTGKVGGDEWIARAWHNNWEDLYTGKGKTPEEAVARLYLALHVK